MTIPTAPDPGTVAAPIAATLPAGIVAAHDAIHINVKDLPAGQACGYTTGSNEIQWTNADFIDHPGAVRICQDAGASDHTADVLDFETGAATVQDLAPWAHEAAQSFMNVTRPGQRSPAIYASASNLTTVVDALISGGVPSGIGLFVAHWGLSVSEAVSLILGASGPFPIIGVQYQNGQTFDYDVFSQHWLDNTSHKLPKLESGWLRLRDVPSGNLPVWFSKTEQTLGYHDANGQWTKVLLP